MRLTEFYLQLALRSQTGSTGYKRVPLACTGQSFGCGSKIGAQNGTLVSGNMDQNLRSPGGLILTIPIWVWVKINPRGDRRF